MTSEKAHTVTTAVVENTERLCQCGILERDITNSTFICYSDNADNVAFRTVLSAPIPYINISTVFSYISQWVDGGANVTVADGLLAVDPMCSVETQSFMEQGCQTDIQVTVERMLPVPAIAGGVAAAVIVTVAVVALVVALVVARKYCR